MMARYARQKMNTTMKSTTSSKEERIASEKKRVVIMFDRLKATATVHVA
jgi:hypothetical protein